MHPVLFEFGPFQIRFYGLMYAIGIMCALYLIRREVPRKHVAWSDDEIINFVMLSVICGIIGARLYYVGFSWRHYQADLSEIVKVWHGGLAIHGGIIGGTLGVWWFVRRHRAAFWKMADIAALPLILAQALGRFGNFMNGDAHGTRTSLPWGVIFPPGSIAGREFPNEPIHPVMLYEMALNAGIFLGLWKLRTRPSQDGFLFCLYLILYSVGRFAVSWFRADNLGEHLIGPLSAPHVISLVIAAAASAWIIKGRLWEPRGDAEA